MWWQWKYGNLVKIWQWQYGNENMASWWQNGDENSLSLHDAIAWWGHAIDAHISGAMPVADRNRKTAKVCSDNLQWKYEISEKEKQKRDLFSIASTGHLDGLVGGTGDGELLPLALVSRLVFRPIRTHSCNKRKCCHFVASIYCVPSIAASEILSQVERGGPGRKHFPAFSKTVPRSYLGQVGLFQLYQKLDCIRIVSQLCRTCIRIVSGLSGIVQRRGRKGRRG